MPPQRRLRNFHRPSKRQKFRVLQTELVSVLSSMYFLWRRTRLSSVHTLQIILDPYSGIPALLLFDSIVHRAIAWPLHFSSPLYPPFTGFHGIKSWRRQRSGLDFGSYIMPLLGSSPSRPLAWRFYRNFQALVYERLLHRREEAILAVEVTWTNRKEPALPGFRCTFT